MEVKQLELEIEGVRQDIRSLQQEIDPLQLQYDQLARELLSLEAELESESPEENPHARSKAQYDDSVPLVQHSYFDESIAHLFADDAWEEPASSKKQKIHQLSYDILARADAAVEVKENILYENVFRFGGITAFPINKTLVKDEILGLRFDRLSHSKHQFITPHYMILRKINRNTKLLNYGVLKWGIHRHTLPVYVPLEQFDKYLLEEDEVEGVRKFAVAIRNSLISTQYKHDKFDAILQMKHAESDIKYVHKLERDLECSRVVITLSLRQKSKQRAHHEIQLMCSSTAIETASMSFANEDFEQQRLVVESVLKGAEFRDLVKKFRKVFDYLLQENVL